MKFNVALLLALICISLYLFEYSAVSDFSKLLLFFIYLMKKIKYRTKQYIFFEIIYRTMIFEFDVQLKKKKVNK